MEKINNGKPVHLDFTKLSKSEQIKYAHAFAEDSEALENLMLFLWQNGINTFSSCAGHPEQGPLASPYLSINTKDMTCAQIQTMLNIVFSMQSLKSIRFQLFYTPNEPTAEMIDSQTKQPCSQNSLNLRWFNDMQALEHFYEQLIKEWNKPLLSRKLSQTQADLINDICTLKDVNLKAVDLSYYKRYYNHLPDSANIATIHYFKSENKFDLSLKFYPISHKYLTMGLKCTPISYAYHPETNRRYMVVDGKVKMVSRQVAEQFFSMQEYEAFLKEHFTKNRETFMKALTGKN